jgi:Right handed beta helix region
LGVVADAFSGLARRRSAGIALGTLLICAGTIACWLSVSIGMAAGTSCDLYASNSGSDNNPGTASAPFLTLKKLLTSLAAGQTGCLASGQTFDNEPDRTGRGSIVVRGGETHGAEGAPVTITSTDPSNPAVISHSVSLEGAADWITFTHLKFAWAQPGQCLWTAEGNPYDCPEEGHVQIAVSSRHTSWTWDEITSEDTNICFNVVSYAGGTAEYTLIEHDRIHDCGTPVTDAHPTVNEEPGWHEHAIYDYGNFTTIRNNYIYNASRDGVLLYPQGNGAKVEHNIIDSSGAGVSLAGVANVVVRWNIITNAYSPRGYDQDGVNTSGAGSGNVVEHNCLYRNPSGELDVSGVTVGENLLSTDPRYASTANHEYTLQTSSQCLGYGPDTAQPATTTSTSETISTESASSEAETTNSKKKKGGGKRRPLSASAATSRKHAEHRRKHTRRHLARRHRARGRHVRRHLARRHHARGHQARGHQARRRPARGGQTPSHRRRRERSRSSHKGSTARAPALTSRTTASCETLTGVAQAVPLAPCLTA